MPEHDLPGGDANGNRNPDDAPAPPDASGQPAPADPSQPLEPSGTLDDPVADGPAADGPGAPDSATAAETLHDSGRAAKISARREKAELAASGPPPADLDTFASDMLSGKKRDAGGFLPDRPRLELQTDKAEFDDDLPSVFVLDGDIKKLGRRSHNDFVIRQSVVSSEHCEFFLTAGVWNVKDLGSTNGVRVNGQRVESSPLKPGDIINFDTLSYVFVDPTRPVAQAGDAKLVVLAGKVNDQVFPLGPTLTIGRRAGNSIVVEDDASISSHHARIDRDDSAKRFRITDLGSRNGTRVDGKQIAAHSPVELLNGTKIQIGELALRVVDRKAPDSPMAAELSTRQLEAAAAASQRGGGKPRDDGPSEQKTDEVPAVRSKSSGAEGANETSDELSGMVPAGVADAAAGRDPRAPRSTAPVAGRTRVQRAGEGAVPGQAKQKRTVRDYGRQYGVFWAVCLIMSLLVVLIFRIASAATSDVGWPGGFGPNFLIFLPMVQALLAGWVVFKADRHTRGPLLLLIALAPWMYAGNLNVNDYGAIYEQVPTSFHNISLGMETYPKGSDGYQKFEQLLDDHLVERSNPAWQQESVAAAMRELRRYDRNEIKEAARRSGDAAFATNMVKLAGDVEARGLVAMVNGIGLHNTGVLLFPVIALMILGITPGLAIAVARRYHPRRLGLAQLNLIGIGGIVLYYVALGVVALLDPNTGTALQSSMFTLPFGLFVLVFPAIALALFVRDWLNPTPGFNVIVRYTLQGFLVVLYLWWTATGAIGAMQWFVDNPDGLRHEHITMGGRVIHEDEMLSSVPAGAEDVPVYERKKIIDTPGSALARSIQHSFALFLLLFANIGLIVCGAVDMVTSVAMPEDDDGAAPGDAPGGPLPRGPTPDRHDDGRPPAGS